MATMYWIGGNGNWGSGSPSGKWSNTSGGPSNGLVPYMNDDVIFNAASGSNFTVTTLNDGYQGGGAARCKSITTVGAVNCTIGGDGLYIHGNADLSGVTMTIGVSMSYNLDSTLTTGGKTLPSLSLTGQPLKRLTLLDDLNVTNGISGGNGGNIFDANGRNVTTSSIDTNGGDLDIYMGSGLWTLTGSGNVWNTPNTSSDVFANTSTLKLTNNSSNDKTITTVSGRAFNNIWIATAGTGAVNFVGPSSFNDFKIGPGAIIKFTAGTTTSIVTFTSLGTAAAPITITSITSAQHTLTKGAGSAYVDYANISYSNATPSATWNARGSINGGNNSGWNFIPGNSRFLTFF